MAKNKKRRYGNGSIYFYVQCGYAAARRNRTDFAGLVLSYPFLRIIRFGIINLDYDGAS
jgi:hypothetical protein